MTKRELRQAVRQRLAEIPPDDLRTRSAAAARLLFAQAEYRRAEIVMIYLSMPAEVDTSSIALRCWSEMKRVLAPQVSWEQRRMLPIEIKSLSSDVQAGAMGIREPMDGLPCPVADIDLVIVPGLAIDKQGNRLGRGRGFYDRFLCHRDFRGVTCAMAFEEQVCDAIPHDETDVRMHMLVTDTTVRRFPK